MAQMGDAGMGSDRGGEALARLYFELANLDDTTGLLEFLHKDVQVSLKTRDGETRQGKEEVESFLAEVSDSRSMFESTAERFRVLDDEHVIVEGRMRWMDEERVLRDDPVVWALEFRDGLLLRSVPARSVAEAEAILAAASPAGPREAAATRRDAG